MADYYDNSDPQQRFQPGTTVRADEVDAKFDEVATGFGDVAADILRALKLPVGTEVDQVINLGPLSRRNQSLGFDSQGNLAVIAGLRWGGEWEPATDYAVGIMVVAPNLNLYVCDEQHTSGSTFSDEKWSLAVNVEQLDQIRLDAEAAQTGAEEAQGVAQSARDGAEDALTSFLKRYLGPHSTPPATDNEGDPLEEGALYLSTAPGDEGMRFWNGSEWVAAYSNVEGLTWNDLSGKPDTATRWPLWGEVTSKPATYPPSSHSHTWNDLSGKPDTATRWPLWGEVTSKPATYPPSSHSHTLGEITDAGSAAAEDTSAFDPAGSAAQVEHDIRETLRQLPDPLLTSLLF